MTKTKIPRAKARELREAMQGYTANLGNHKRGSFEELRLFRALVAAINDIQFSKRFETAIGGRGLPSTQEVEDWMALFTLANDHTAFDPHKSSDRIKLSVIEGPITKAA